MAAAGDQTKALERARAKLTKNDDAGALDALLIAWRGRRHARIADLIDRVSDRLMSVRGPIKARTVKERTAKWLALAKKKDPADLGSLLATPWPGTWIDALPLVAPLTKFPHDPRISMALARIVDATPFDTWRSIAFYRPLLDHLGKVLDPRVLAMLEIDVERTKSSYWRRTRALENTIIQKHKTAYAKGLPVLSKTEEAAVVLLEGMFSELVSAERAKAVGESDFLKAIYEAPDDDALREVFADWLTERNDPRGELITLQLARHGGRFSEATLKREASLLKKHATAWAGELDRVLEKEGRVWARGFLSSGILDIGNASTPPRELSDPAWATFHCLEIGHGLASAIMDLPSMAWVRGFRGLDQDAVIELAKGNPRPRLEELGFEAEDDDDGDDDDDDDGDGNGDQAQNTRERDTRNSERAAARELIGNSTAFPNLKRISIETDIKSVEWLLRAPIAKRLERITIEHYEYPIGSFARLVEKLRLPATEVCASDGRGYWLFTARRDADGRFTKIHGEPFGSARVIPSRYGLNALLEKLEPNDLTELTIAREHVTCNYGQHDIEVLETRLGTFPKLTRIEVPWERVKPSTEGTALALTLSGKGISKKRSVSKLWKLLEESPLSLSFDSYSVNDGKHTALPEDAFQHVMGYYAKKRTKSVHVYRKGSNTCSFRFNIGSYREWITVTSAWKGDEDLSFVDRYVEWLVRALDAVDVEHGECPFDLRSPGASDTDNADTNDAVEEEDGVETIEPIRYNPQFGWIMILGKAHAKIFLFDELEKLPKTPGLEWLRVVQTERNALLVLGPHPHQMPNAAGRLAVQLGLISVMWKGFKALYGFLPRDLVLSMLGPPLAKHGFEPVPLDPLRTAMGQVLFVARTDPAMRYGIHVEPMRMGVQNLRFVVHARRAPTNPPPTTDANVEPLDLWDDVYQQKYSHLSASTEKKAQSALTNWLSVLENETMKFLVEGPPPPTPRRRSRRR